MNKELKELLGTLSLFQGVDDSRLDALIQNASNRTYKAGQIIVSETERRKAFYLLLSGRAKMFKMSPEGKEQTLYIFEAGEPFCVCAAIQGRRFPGNATALEPSRVLSLDQEAFRNIAQQDPALLFNILMVLSQRLRHSMQLVESLALQELPQRIATYLLHAAPAASRENTVHLPMSYREFAKILGTTPESLSRTLKRMHKHGLLSTDGRDITIPDRERLSLCAEFGIKDIGSA